MIDGKYNLHFDHRMAVGTDKFPDEVGTWCKDNCDGRWGWYWEVVSGSPTVFVTFERESDLIDFALLRGESYGKSFC